MILTITTPQALVVNLAIRAMMKKSKVISQIQATPVTKNPRPPQLASDNNIAINTLKLKPNTSIQLKITENSPWQRVL